VQLAEKSYNIQTLSHDKEKDMPLVEIHMLEGRTEKQKKALLESVTEAIRGSLDVPLASIRIWIREFSPKDYMIAGELYANRKK
jgi:4-oxalocrotonate tautomerase